MGRAYPYAAKAVVEHVFDVDHLDVYMTFRFSMDESVKPPNALWLCEVNDVLKPVTVSAWQDAWTMLLTVPNIPVLPGQVTLQYDGPHEDLRITWGKQWEPWGPIVSVALPPVSTTRTFSTGPAQQNAVDVSNVNVLFLNCVANDITIGGFIGGVNGQVLNIAKICPAANDTTLKHADVAGTQKLYLHRGADETLTGEFGGWILVCDGSNWYDASHAKHV